MRSFFDTPEFKQQLFDVLKHFADNVFFEIKLGDKTHIEVTETPHRAPHQPVQQKQA